MEMEKNKSICNDLELPGFRFHPTEEELLNFYLKKVANGNKLHFDIIGFLNIYHYDPCQLPELAKIGEREWYFFVPRDRKHGHGGRPNRTTENGFWKATGSDRHIRSISEPKKVLGLKKTLVFYKGRAPKGSKTDWIMNEYRLIPTNSNSNSNSTQEDVVLCKIYRKATSLKVLEQRAAMEERSRMSHTPPNSSSFSNTLYTNEQEGISREPSSEPDILLKTKLEEEEEDNNINEEKLHDQEKKVVIDGESLSSSSRDEVCSSVRVREKLTELEVPKMSMVEMTSDPALWTQLRSPWLDHWSPYYADLLAFQF